MADQTVQAKFTAVGGGEIQIGLTRKPITAWGGVAVFAAFCETVGLRAVLDRVSVFRESMPLMPPLMWPDGALNPSRKSLVSG